LETFSAGGIGAGIAGGNGGEVVFVWCVLVRVSGVGGFIANGRFGLGLRGRFVLKTAAIGTEAVPATVGTDTVPAAIGTETFVV
jgi:hypothetical protein